jgi:hypothetical protein
VSDAWQQLMDAGLPDGAVRPVPRGPFDAARLRAAVRDVVARPEVDVAPLLAWLRAWQHHWPRRFRATFGDEGERIVDRLSARLEDENRYLKLRRIAIENLAAVL